MHYCTSEDTTKNPTFHRPESVFNPTASLFVSSSQHLTESDKILVNFALTLNTAMLADGLWAIRNTDLTARAKHL